MTCRPSLHLQRRTLAVVFFHDFIHDLFQHAGAAPIATTIILQPITITINIMYNLVPMDMTLSMIPHILVLRSKTSVYTFSTLLITFDWDQSPVSSMHHCSVQDQSSPFIIQLRFYSTSTPPTVYSSRRARLAVDCTIFLSTRAVSYRSRVPFPLFVRSLLVVTYGRGTSISFGVFSLSHRASGCLRTLYSAHASWPWLLIDCQSPPVTSRWLVLIHTISYSYLSVCHAQSLLMITHN